MSDSQGATSPFKDSAFSGIFLGWCIGALTLSVFFLSYFNRAFASILSFVVRTYAWRFYSVYIDIQALQISLLGGRIFFTRLRYHGENETILIQKGYITWSYWQWRVRDVGIHTERDEVQAQAEGKSLDKRKTKKLPCRVNVVVSGVEWFVYNRSGVYESVLESLLDNSTAAQPDAGIPQEEDAQTRLRKRNPRSTGDALGSGTNPTLNSGASAEGSSLGPGKRQFTSGTFESGVGRKQPSDDELPLLLQFFPIHLQCSKVGVVMGNENTKAIMIIKAKGLEGEIDAVSTNTPDPYRQVYTMKFDNPVIEMRDNEDYREEQAERAVREKQVARDTKPLPRRSRLRIYRRKTVGRLRDLVPFWRLSVESLSADERASVTATARPAPDSHHWQGLTRYLDDLERNEHLRWASVQYAAVTTVLDSPEATFTIYWDTPGLVAPHRPETLEKSTDAEGKNNINGDVSPAWGIRLSIKGGTVNYGPWADRHRAEIQRVFFPGICKDAQPAKPLPTGASRMPTQFKLYVELDDDVTLRVPIREESKNWKFRGKEPPPRSDKARDKRKTRDRLKQTDQSTAGGHDRQLGWLDVRVAANSTVSYQSDTVAGPNGFSSSLDLEFPSTEISSSINHEVLWRSKKLGTSCDLSTPLKWNGLRQWKFDVTTDDLDLFILRDHIFLLTDLVNDWSDGPPPEYLTFTPFKYFLNLHFRNLNLYLNVNDGNIINKPTDLDDNAYIIIKSPLLESSTCIALDKYRPAKNMIAFDARTDEAVIRIHVPPWNTQASFLKSMDMGHLENLVVDGQYHYNAITSPATTDTLVLNISGQSPVFHLYGFVIRYFLKMKDNYFGDDVHFKTLEEYQELQELKKTDPEAESRSKAPPKKSNDMDVIISIKADDPKIFLPANLYSSNRNVQIEGTCLGVDLRFTNYYMDLDLTLSPLHLSLGSSSSGRETPMSTSSATELFVDGLNVYGHRVFGLPPVEPTYLCNWDISLGAVTGECSAPFLRALMSGGKAFGLTFDDDENALIPFSDTVVYDVTFLRVAVHSVRLWLRVDEAAFLFSTGSIDVNYNDWARTHYSKRANIKIPDIELSCVSGDSIARHRARAHDAVDTDLMIRTNVHLATVGRKFDFSHERELQQNLIRHQDQRVPRTPFLVLPDLHGEHVPTPVDPPAQSVPPVPPPVLDQDVPNDRASLESGGSSIRSWGFKHRASFLSMSTSSSGSVIGPRSSKRASLQSRYPEGPRAFTAADKRLSGYQGTHQRDLSASTGHRSAFYSAYGDVEEARDQAHNTVAFSSQYFAPYFPLETVRPDTPDALVLSIEADEGREPSAAAFDLGDIDPDTLKEDRVYSSTMVELPTGLTGFVNPTALKNVAVLITALQPSEPEDVLDTLQEEALSGIFGKKKKQDIKGTISDLHVRIPRANIRLVNSSQLDASGPIQEEQDQYDFTLNDLAVTTRDETTWEDSFDSTTFRSKNSFHTRLGLFELAASERLSSRSGTHAAVKAQIENVLVSMGTKDVSYLDGDIGGINCSLSSKELEYLTTLADRTTTLVTDLGKVFASTSRESELKKYLTHRLISEGPDAIDPLFLIRPSAVLRSATNHLRTYDSWKLISRLRQIWVTLDPAAQEQLRLDCLGSALDVPVDARQQVISGFERWRSWDLHNANMSELIEDIFGKDKSETLSPPAMGLAFMAVMRLRDTRFVLDPGPRQNEIAIVEVTARYQDAKLLDVEVTPTEPSESQSGKDAFATFNVYCGEVAVKINWDLLELGENVLKLYTKLSNKEEAPVAEDPQPSKPSTTPLKQFENGLQVSLAVNRGEVAFDAINLQAATLADGLKASLLLRNNTDISDTNFIIGCDAVTSRVRSHGQVLGVFQLRDAAVIVSHTLQATENEDQHTIKGSASSKEANMEIQQDPLALLEVLDLLIRDEGAQLYRLQSQLPSSPKPAKPERKIKDRLSSFKVNVAMFLDEYYISVPLLQSMTYCVSGVVARAAVAANFGKELIFDFDVKENSHEIQMRVNNKARSLSLLQIPPLNGRIKMRTSEGQKSINTSASVELVTLDASAVYSLLSALNRPEISSSVNDIQEQISGIQTNIRETFKTDNQTPAPQATPIERAPKPPNALVYEVHVTAEGLEIFGHTPLKSDTEPLAHILFRLGRVHYRMTNRPSISRPILDNPEVYVNMQQIEWKIERGTEGNFRTCGRVAFGALITATAQIAADGSEQRHFNITTDGFDVILSPETISTSVDAGGFMNDKIKDLDTSRELELLRKLRQTKPKILINDEKPEEQQEPDFFDNFLTSVRYNFEIRRMQIVWLVLMQDEQPSEGKEDLVFTWDKIELGTRTRNSARLSVENFQVQTVPTAADKRVRSANSALMPEVVFNVAYVSTANTRRMAFQAVGKSLDLRLTSGFIIPVANVVDSIQLSVENIRQAAAHWAPPTTRRPSQPVETPAERKAAEPRRPMLGNKRLESLMVDADFAGAMVYLAAKKEFGDPSQSSRAGVAGKYGQFSTDGSGSGTLLKSPGIAFKVEYRDPGEEDPSLYGELKIDASSNTLYPSFVPLVMDLTSSIKEVVSNDHEPKTPPQQTLAKAKTAQEEYLLDPSAVIGRLKLNLGLRICKQEFTMSCQPIARVAATASFDDVYFTVNTVASADQGKFFAMAGAVTNLRSSVRHVYSREETGQFNVESIVLSLMNSKHVSGISGVSAILKFSPMDVSINAKQLQDFLLFREIWAPRDVRQQTTTSPVAKLSTETSQGVLVQRYQQVAATAAFPWTATISVAALEITVDLGQAIGKSKFSIQDFWVSSKKTSDWEQNLCLGFHRIGIESQGRMSGFVALQDFQLRTSIQWPEREQALNETPMVQASVTFSQFRVKAAFDYQAFLVADITSLNFLMYNVRRASGVAGNRLVATIEGEAVQIFGTTTSAALGIALYQAFQKLIQERKASFETSLREIEKFMKRKSTSSVATLVQRPSIPKAQDDELLSKAPISLDTDVVVTFKALNLGIFPTSFSDHQVFKAEALDAQARFAASLDNRRIHSTLGLTLGQLRIGLASVRTAGAPKALSELAVEDVVASATGSRGGTILKVPKVEAIMQTWQAPNSREIDYIFKSAFEGKVEVGWNYSRISYIRGMIANHNRSLAQAWGKELSGPIASAIKVTGALPGSAEEQKQQRDKEGDEEAGEKGAASSGSGSGKEQKQKQKQKQQQQGKITAEVELPQSKYEYRALVPPIIETPQLRDMGEATPPLEWIGLHRDRLPTLTHQIVIVSLLELAGEVEDAYSRILGSS